jgi:hypothetical protein
MDSCKALDKPIKSAIKNSDSYDQYDLTLKALNESFFMPDILKCNQLAMHLLVHCDDKELFIKTFLTKKNCGLSEFNSNKCICERYIYITVFASSCANVGLAENFFVTFKDLINFNKHRLID